MGGCLSGSAGGRKASREIDRGLEVDNKKRRQEVKLLLLGTGESGKSTIFKQMKIIQINGGFTTDELKTYKFVVYGNCINQMKVVVNAANKLGLPFQNEQNKASAERLTAASSSGDDWTVDIGVDIQNLWSDPAIRSATEKKDQLFQLNDSAEYFFENIARINKNDYLPTVDDVLRSRIRSTGIEEAVFNFEDISFRMVDVGGQRSERRKWIHCFEGSTAIVFCVALSEYDQKLREEDSINRMEESLMLFEEVCNSKYFRQTSIILFLNKVDIFKEKILRVPLSVCPQFQSYQPTDGAQYESASQYIKGMFLEKDQAKTHQIFPHFTIAVDTKNINTIWKDVTETLLREIIQNVSM